MNIKLNIKQTLVLLLALAILLLPAFPVNAEASQKTESMALLVGERITSTALENIKSVSSSSKKIVAAKKDPDNSQRAIITAKKPGTATVKIKTARGTAVYKITVKKANIKVTPDTILPDGNVLFKVTNNTSMTYDYIYVEYTLKNPENEIINDKQTDGSYRNNVSVECLQPKKTAYFTVSPSYGTTADLANCSGKVDLAKYNSLRSLSATYKNRTKKVAVSAKLTSDAKEISVSCKNKYSGSVSGIVYVKVFDGDTFVAMKKLNVHLNGSQSKKETIPISSLSYTYSDLNVKLLSSSFYSKQF